MALPLPAFGRIVGDGDHTGDHNLLVAYLSNLGSSTLNVKTFGATGDGRTDDTAAVQSALDAAAGGGSVFFPTGVYSVRNITVHGNTVVTGSGASSVIQARPGTTGALFALHTPAADAAVNVVNIKFDGNNIPQLTNIFFDNQDLATTDGLHRFMNVVSSNAGYDAFHLGTSVLETTLFGCHAYNCGRYGFNFDVSATDNRVYGCSAGLIAGHGFYITGNTTHFTDCKAYYCGIIRGTDDWTPGVHGFMLQPAGYDFHMVSLVGCEAQNNSQHGFCVDGASPGSWAHHLTFTNCMADGNNEGLRTGAEQGNGFSFDAMQTSCVNGCITHAQIPAAQAYGLAVYGDCSGTTFGANSWTGALGGVTVDPGASGYSFMATTTTPPSGGVGL